MPDIGFFVHIIGDIIENILTCLCIFKHKHCSAMGSCMYAVPEIFVVLRTRNKRIDRSVGREHRIDFVLMRACVEEYPSAVYEGGIEAMNTVTFGIVVGKRYALKAKTRRYLRRAQKCRQKYGFGMTYSPALCKNVGSFYGYDVFAGIKDMQYLIADKVKSRFRSRGIG